MSDAQWEKAFLAQSQDAAIGRMFRGIIHNLNGSIQVFSLQADLNKMMLNKALGLIDQMRHKTPSPELELLAEAVGQRLDSSGQIQDRVRQCQLLLQRVLILPDFQNIPGGGRYTVNALLETELEFLSADPWFKHKVEKRIQLDDAPPPLNHCQLEIHQIVHFLLQNTREALEGSESPQVLVSSALNDGYIEIGIEDNGCGVDPAVRPRLFDPFVSTKEGHAGLGLYLARVLADRCGGNLTFESSPGRTRFLLSLPVETGA